MTVGAVYDRAYSRTLNKMDKILIAGIDCVAAISVTTLYDLYVPRGSYAWLRRLEPTTRIGWSIYVYDLRKR